MSAFVTPSREFVAAARSLLAENVERPLEVDQE